MHPDWNVMTAVPGSFPPLADIAIASFYSKSNSASHLCAYKRGDTMEVILSAVSSPDYSRNSLIKKTWDDVNTSQWKGCQIKHDESCSRGSVQRVPDRLRVDRAYNRPPPTKLKKDLHAQSKQHKTRGNFPKPKTQKKNRSTHLVNLTYANCHHCKQTDRQRVQIASMSSWGRERERERENQERK